MQTVLVISHNQGHPGRVCEHKSSFHTVAIKELIVQNCFVLFEAEDIQTFICSLELHVGSDVMEVGHQDQLQFSCSD